MRPTSCHPLSPYLAPPTPPGLWEGWRGRVQGASCAHPLGSCKQWSWWGQALAKGLALQLLVCGWGTSRLLTGALGWGSPQHLQGLIVSTSSLGRAWHTVPTTDRDDLRFLEEKVEVAGGQGSQWGI